MFLRAEGMSDGRSEVINHFRFFNYMGFDVYAVFPQKLLIPFLWSNENDCWRCDDGIFSQNIKVP